MTGTVVRVAVLPVVPVVAFVFPVVSAVAAVVGAVQSRFMSIGSEVVMPPLHAVSRHDSATPAPAILPKNRRFIRFPPFQILPCKFIIHVLFKNINISK